MLVPEAKVKNPAPPDGTSPGRDPALTPRISDPILRIESLSLWYGEKQALDAISLEVPERRITAFIGPSGCGKSTLLRCINRLNDLVDDVRIEGDIRLEGSSVYDPQTDVNALRKRVGMVFQKSNPFPKSIFDNVAFGPRISGLTNIRKLSEIVDNVTTKIGGQPIASPLSADHGYRTNEGDYHDQRDEAKMGGSVGSTHRQGEKTLGQFDRR